MKVLRFALCLLLFSCGKSSEVSKSPQAILDSNIVEHLRKIAHDPSSYQYISTKAEDTVTYYEATKKGLKMYESTLSNQKRRLAVHRDYGGPTDNLSGYKKDIEKTQASIKKRKLELDSLKTGKKADYPLILRFTHSCRLKNAFGGLMGYNYEVLTDSSLNVLSITDPNNK